MEVDVQLRILADREKRMDWIEEKLNQCPLILTVRCNYPGRNKNEPLAQSIVEMVDEEIQRTFDYYCRHIRVDYEGVVILYQIKAVGENGYDIKKKAIAIEETHPLGRLVDLDVYSGSVRSISRRDLGIPPRRCFLCSKDAHHCSRQRTHKEEDLLSYIEGVVKSYASSL